jgi:hypothetical protein
MLDAKNENLQNSEEKAEKIEASTPLIVEKEKTEEKVEKIESSISLPAQKEKPDEDTISQEAVIEEIDNQIAHASEGEHNDEEVAVNYDELDLEPLVQELKKLIEGQPIQKINDQVNRIKNSFNKKFSTLLAEKKSAFLAEGGESIDFKYSNPIKVEYNDLMKDFKDKRSGYYKNLDVQLNNNLELKLSIIDQLKELIQNGDAKTMYSQFREIQDRWKSIGPISRDKYNNTWRTYHHHVERFYDLLHLSNDLRDLDFKHNLEEKLKLVTRAEELAEHHDINYAFKQLQLLHKMWKEEVGPVSKDFREKIWNDFSAATKKIHDKRHDNFRSMKSKYQENIANKIEIVELIKSVDTSKNSSHSDWQKSMKIIDELRELFFKVGNVPKSESEPIWQSFKEATREFNQNKNDFYKKSKGEQSGNLEKKLKLIEKADSLKDSDDWESVTETMKSIQSDWKKIGHVPRKHSDKIWNQFKSACNHYFDRYHEFKDVGSKEEQEVFTKKKELLEFIKENTSADDTKFDLDTIKGYIEQWRGLGNVPLNLRHIESKFSKVLDKLFSLLSIDPKEKEMIKFENQMEGLVAQNNVRKLDGEQIQIRKKIDESVREIQQLENNISFFSNAKSDNPLLKGVLKNISDHKENLEVLKGKLNILKKLNY